jgi:hypothetical protein
MTSSSSGPTTNATHSHDPSVIPTLAYINIKSLERSLDYYKRALGWAGVARGGDGRTGEEILEAEWRALLGNYSRVREALHVKNTEG